MSNMTQDIIKNCKVDFSKNVIFTLFFFQIFASKFLSVFTIFQDYNFHPTPTISISYASCILYPSEIAEAINLASATSQSDQWQSHRKLKV